MQLVRLLVQTFLMLALVVLASSVVSAKKHVKKDVGLNGGNVDKNIQVNEEEEKQENIEEEANVPPKNTRLHRRHWFPGYGYGYPGYGYGYGYPGYGGYGYGGYGYGGRGFGRGFGRRF